MNSNDGARATDPEQVSIPQTNDARLRAHLAPDTLAIRLLDAWDKGNPGVQSRMVSALHTFSNPESAK